MNDNGRADKITSEGYVWNISLTEMWTTIRITRPVKLQYVGSDVCF